MGQETQVFCLVHTVTGNILATSSIGNPVKTLTDLKQSFLEVQKRNLGVCFPENYAIRRKEI